MTRDEVWRGDPIHPDFECTRQSKRLAPLRKSQRSGTNLHHNLGGWAYCPVFQDKGRIAAEGTHMGGHCFVPFAGDEVAHRSMTH